MRRSRAVVVLGGGLYGSAITLSLNRAGIETVLVIDPAEANLRRNLCFSDVTSTGRKEIQQVSAILVDENLLAANHEESFSEVWKKTIDFHLDNGDVPVFIHNEFPNFLDELNPEVIVGAQELISIELASDSAKLIIGLYPYYQLNSGCKILIETRLNYFIGQILHADSDVNVDIEPRFFRQPFQQIHTPLEGVFITQKELGDSITTGEPIGTIQDIEIRSPYEGQIWGLLHSGRLMQPKQAIALIYEGNPHPGFQYFDFGQLAVAGSVLREVLYFLR
jgi:xanthine dehydrogenase accessory factor